MAATIWYHDILAQGSIPAGPSAANRVASGIGNLWCTALVGGSSFTRTQTNVGGIANIGGLVLSTTGPTRATTYLFPAADTSGTPSYQTPTPGMFAAIRLRFRKSPMQVGLALGPTITVAPYNFAAVLNIYATSAGTNGVDGLILASIWDNAANQLQSGQVMPLAVAGPSVNSSSAFCNLDLALCVRSVVSTGVYLCEIWVRSEILGNAGTDDWCLLTIANIAWSGTICPYLWCGIYPTIPDATVMDVTILEWIWGKNDPLHDPGLLSREKPIGRAHSSYPVTYNVPVSPCPAGIARTSSNYLVAVTEGLAEIAGDCSLNVYTPDSTFTNWTSQTIFAPTTAPGLTIQYTGGGTTASYTVTTTSATARAWTPTVNGVVGTPLSMALFNASDLATIAGLINGYSGWTATVTNGAPSGAAGVQLVEKSVANAKIATAHQIQQCVWNGCLASGKGNNADTVLAFGARYIYDFGGSTVKIVWKVSTDGGTTWSNEMTLVDGVSYVLEKCFWSDSQQKWILYGYDAAGAMYTCSKAIPSASADWMQVSTTFGLNEIEPRIAECTDGTLFCISRASSGPMKSEYSIDGGVTWSTLTAMDGGYSAGVQIRSYIPSDNSPGDLFQTNGYLWLVAPCEDWSPYSTNVRANSVIYRSTAKVTAANVATILFQPWKRSLITAQMAVSNKASYPFTVTDGRELAMVCGRDMVRFVYDADFFDADYVPVAYSDPAAANVLANTTYKYANAEMKGTLQQTITVIEIATSIAGQNLSVIPGDAYDSITGQLVQFTDPGTWPIIGSSEVKCFIAPLNQTIPLVNTVASSVTGPPQIVTVNLTAAQTTQLVSGQIYDYQVTTNLGSSEIRTLVVGQMTALPAIAETW